MSEYDVRLTDRVRTRGVLTPDDAARFLLPVAESLAALHATGRSHGAVSPAAIQVDADGIATLLEPDAVAPDPTFTAPDPTWGLRPHPMGNDVWSFAAVLLHVTTGRAPTDRAADPRSLGWLGPLAELAMQVDPRDRPTMADVVDYLRARVEGPAPARRVSGLAMVAAGAAVIVGLALAGAALLFAGGDDGGDGDGRTSDSAASRDTASSDRDDTDEPTATEATSPVSAVELEEFARAYVATASGDPDRGFDLLTRNYQQSSPRYREVWSSIKAPRILSVDGDPDTLSVTYTYAYRYDGAPRTEEVRLQLVRSGDRLLIAGATGRPR